MKFSILIPQHDNEHKDFHPIALEDVYRLLWKEYGGLTLDAVADGYWLDKDEDRLYIDKVRRATVVTSESSQAMLEWARHITQRIGSLLGQKVMYFEHDYYGFIQVEFLDIDPKKTYVGLF